MWGTRRTREIGCFVVLLATLGVLVCAATLGQAQAGAILFAGKWVWSGDDYAAFTLDLTQAESELKGHHTAVALRVDDVPGDQPPSIVGSVKRDTAIVTFKSGYDDGKGRATLTLQGGFLQWHIVKSSGEHYLPRTAKLQRAKRP